MAHMNRQPINQPIRQPIRQSHLPLPANSYIILVGLAVKPSSVYELIQYYHLNRGTAYPAMRQLVKTRYAQAVPDASRPMYELTRAGWLVIEQETNRLSQLTPLAMQAIATHSKRQQTWLEQIKAIKSIKARS